ncbi:MAG: glycosyl hydrolase family 18 protein, partial [Actinomycetota bacterium]|nr:glycosyl hydrolase family 18 protein [Actinomycetota bacterium]
AAPHDLRFERLPGRTWGTLSWPKGPRGTRYRVYRNRAVVGQTPKRSMRVRVRIGPKYTFTVRPVSKRGKVGRCARKLTRRIAYVLPTRPEAIGATPDVGAATVRLAWQRASRGDARLNGYRILRDGATYGQTKDAFVDVKVASHRSYVFTVAAVDARGKLSPASDAVTVETGHTGPPRPAGLEVRDLGDTELTLSWAPSVPGRGRVVGYRVFRDGRMVRQVDGTSFRMTNLAAEATHSLTVVAVDSLGYLSPPSEPLSATTARPEQSTGRAHAFLLASTDRSFQDLRDNYRRIGTVHPTYFDCTSAGALIGRDDPLITGWARQRGVRVLARFNCQRGAVLNRILREPVLRETWLSRMVELVEAHGYDGVSLDFETGYAADRDVFSAFVAELAQRLHDRGRLLSVAVSPKFADVPNHPRSTFFDYRELARHADTVFVMAWGIHWATSAPGAQDDLTWMRKVVEYVKTLPDRGPFVLGIQLYGMDWAGDGGTDQPADAYEYDDVMALAARTGSTPVRDPVTDAMHFSYVDEAGVPHQVWFTNADTQATRLQLARDAGMGIGFWRLGREDQRLWQNPLLGP